MRITKLAAILITVVLLGCATAEQQKLGNVVHTGGIGGWGIPVYAGKINKPYKVVKKLREKRRQIPGANYYDDLSGAGWMAAAGKKVGADAVIDFGARRIEGEQLFDVGYFEAWGTAVKFAK